MKCLNGLASIPRAGVDILRIPLVQKVETEPNGSIRSGLKWAVTQVEGKVSWMILLRHKSRKTGDIFFDKLVGFINPGAT